MPEAEALASEVLTMTSYRDITTHIEEWMSAEGWVDECIWRRNSRQGSIVVIAGRPNVGKSSLFNRLIKNEKLSLTRLGVTRDPVEEYCRFGEKRLFLLIQGFKLELSGWMPL